MKSITFLLDEGGYENTVRGRKTSGSDGKGQSLWKLSGPTAPITATIIHSRIRLLVVLSCYICNNTVFLPVPADLITHKSIHCVHNKTSNKDLRGCFVLSFTLPFCFVNKAVVCPLSSRTYIPLKSWGRFFFALWCCCLSVKLIYSLASARCGGHKRRLCSSAKGTAAVDMHLSTHQGYIQHSRYHVLMPVKIIKAQPPWSSQ